MKAPIRILLIDDEITLREATATALERFGIVTTLAANGREGLVKLYDEPFDLVVLDLRMDIMDGWSFLDDPGRSRATPVIILTAAVDVLTRTRAFEAGAVDYVAKPFFVEELAARIEARAERAAPPGDIQFGACRLSPSARMVTRHGRPVPLSPTEYEILLFLALRAGRPARRAVMADHVLPSGLPHIDRTVDAHVARLRAKLGADRDCIETVRGIGWRLRLETP